MKTVFASIATVFLLSGCLVGELEKVTKETRDYVKESKDLIRDTRDGTQTSVALEICLDSHVSESSRVGACKNPLLRVPEDRLGDYLGIPLRVMQESSVKRDVPFNRSADGSTFDTAELDMPNVIYVGEPGDRNFDLRLAAMEEQQHHVFRMSLYQLIPELVMGTRRPGLSAAEMDTYRDNARRLSFLAPAIFGAVQLAEINKGLGKLSQMLIAQTLGPDSLAKEGNAIFGTTPKIVPLRERNVVARGLRELGKNVSLTERELLSQEVMIRTRLLVR